MFRRLFQKPFLFMGVENIIKCLLDLRLLPDLNWVRRPLLLIIRLFDFRYSFELRNEGAI